MDLSDDDVEEVLLPVKPKQLIASSKATGNPELFKTVTTKTVALDERLTPSPKLQVISRFVCTRKHDYLMLTRRGDVLSTRRPLAG